jgi:hypothetical protein
MFTRGVITPREVVDRAVGANLLDINAYFD